MSEHVTGPVTRELGPLEEMAQMATMINRFEYADDAEFNAEHNVKNGCHLAARPYVAPGGWDARQLECDTHHVFVCQVRGMPAEGILIDPDPHLHR